MHLFLSLSVVFRLRLSTTKGNSRIRTHTTNTWKTLHAHADLVRAGVNKHIPGIKGHVSRESVCGCLAKEKAYAAVEAVSVCARGRGGCGGDQRALLQQGQGVGRAVAQRVRAAAQLFAAVRVHTVNKTVWSGQKNRDRKKNNYSNEVNPSK